MANGIVGVFKEVYEGKKQEIYDTSNRRYKAIEQKLRERNTRYRALIQKIEAAENQVQSLENVLRKLRKEKQKKFPGYYDAKTKAVGMLSKDYLNLITTITVDKIPERKIKKMLESFRNKDYFAKVRGL